MICSAPVGAALAPAALAGRLRRGGPKILITVVPNSGSGNLSLLLPLPFAVRSHCRRALRQHQRRAAVGGLDAYAAGDRATAGRTVGLTTERLLGSFRPDGWWGKAMRAPSRKPGCTLT